MKYTKALGGEVAVAKEMHYSELYVKVETKCEGLL